MADEHDVEPEHPDHRRTSDEYRRWNDDRLDADRQRSDERFAEIGEELRKLNPLIMQVGLAQAAIDGHADEMRGIRRHVRDVETRMTLQIARVEKTCTDFHKEYREDQEAAKNDQIERDKQAAKDQQAAKSATRQAVVMVIVAIIGMTGVIVAAIISRGGL